MKKSWIPYIFGALLAPFVIYGAWELGRKINYSLAYEDMVIETICKMVKPEYLIKPCIT